MPIEDGFGLYLVLTDPVAGYVRCAEAAVEATRGLCGVYDGAYAYCYYTATSYILIFTIYFWNDVCS